MKFIAFKSTMPALAIITRFTTAALLLLALVACNSGGGGGGGGSTPIIGKSTSLKPTELVATGFYQGIDLTWKAAKDATSYTVYYHTVSFDSSTDSTADGGVKSQTGITTTNASITGLENGTLYYLRVEANGKTDNYLSEIIKATTNLQPPTELKATGVYQGIDLSWKEAKGATSYTVYYHTANIDETPDSKVDSTTDITTTKISITGLDNDKTYYLRVKAVNAKAKVETKLSEQVDATPAAQAPNLIATGAYLAIDLTWDAVTHATGYIVYYHTAEIDSTTVSEAKSITVNNPKTTKANITDLTNGTKYYLRAVTNYSGGVVSGFSKEVTITAKAKTQAPILGATGVNRGVDLSWDGITTAASYTVYYHTAAFSSATLSGAQEKTTDTTNISITDLTNDKKYYFRAVTNYSGGVVSDLSKQVEATADLPPPTNLQATGKDKAIDLTWDAVTGATKYTVYYHKDEFDGTTDKAGNRVDSTTDITTTNTSITGLDGGTEYFIRLVASNQEGDNSRLSSVVSAITILPAPTKLQATGQVEAIDLTWDAVTGATSYTVYYRKDNSFDSISDSTADGVIQSKPGITKTSTSIDGLLDYTTYHFRVIASNAKVSSGLSPIQSATTKLPAPQNFSGVANYLGVDLSWDAVAIANANVTGYRIYYSDGTTDTTDKTEDTIGLNSTTVSIDLSSGSYSFQVAALVPDAGITKSKKLTLTIPKLPAPQKLSAAASIISPAAVDLSWDAVDGVTGYNIYYADVSLDGLNGGYTNYATVGGKLDTTTDTSITIGDLTVDTTYYFVVAAAYKEEEAAAKEVSADSSYIAELAMGGHSSCVRLNTGSIKCWGNNNFGQLGVDDTTDRYTATSVPNFRAKQLSVGNSHSCAIDLKGKLYCWGSNLNFKLGLDGSGDTKDYHITPTQVTQAKLAKVSLVSAGYTSTCALADGNNYCWGDQNNGGLGNRKNEFDPTMDAQEIDRIKPDVKQFALGKNSGCAIDASNDLYCWGLNDRGQVGYGESNVRQLEPAEPTLAKSSTATMLAGKISHYCAVDKATKIQCWGDNERKQLGISSADEKSTTPQYVRKDTSGDHLTGVSKVTVGYKHSCALIKDVSADSNTGGKVRCWGGFDHGIIGINPIGKIPSSDDRSYAYIDMRDINNTVIDTVIDIAAGFEHTCVLLADRAKVRCWGRNNHGQLGNGKTKNSHTLVAVEGL